MKIPKVNKQIYHPYYDWECYHNGMYNRGLSNGMDIVTAKIMYSDFLRDTYKFKNAMLRVKKEWPKSCEHFLTNGSINRIAWLGQAAMCIETGISSYYKSGFTLLSNDEQDIANNEAKIFLIEWIDEYNNKNQ